MLHFGERGAHLSGKRKLKSHHFSELRATEWPRVEARTIANSRFEWKMRGESNPTLQNLVTAKNIWKIFTCRHFCADDSHSE